MLGGSKLSTKGVPGEQPAAQDFLYLPYDPAEGANEGGLASCRQLVTGAVAGTCRGS